MRAFLYGSQGGDVAAEEREFDAGVGDLHSRSEGFTVLGVAAAEDDVGGVVFREGAG